MITVSTIKELREYTRKWRREGLSIGLVPTMGYLHEGHRSLIDKAVKENDKVVVSIFVNPTQFGPNEDLSTYPRDIHRDKELCQKTGADIVFNPEASEMYFNNASTYVDVENLTEGLCGAKRPGHFRGVCTIVSKLFNIVNPDRAYFGEKDAQQLAVIRRMVRDLNFDIQIIGCPIIREEDGLAKSSRNAYLSPEERSAATILNKSLMKSKELLENGEMNTEVIKSKIKSEIDGERLAKIDYIEIVDKYSLETVSSIKNSILIVIAVFIGNTRLIDNFIFELEEK
ncbi:pantoate--beta-alanine ligase [Clostridium sp. HMP27]|uniref:pantoate--beta-alanine ligase n=1 Tax=Clostridium sp. HMP27 TaxID=1487921 RepID=UPI00052CFC17|nr:pantoate--beta-alanine ligase [Clostridium sp. HMP27]KGK84233.1 pantoate--beta-alanine ligase [Clostridium sp. HMP27]